MSLYGTALFIHIVFAILLVGGSAWLHVAIGLAKRANDVSGVRSHTAFIHAFVKASMPISMVTLVAGLYMAFDADLWGSGWVEVSLAVFLATGAAAGGIIDPTVGRLEETVESAADGPITPEIHAQLRGTRLTIVAWLFAGGDLALVYMMTNKPGFAGAGLTVAIGLAFGAAMAARELRLHRAEVAVAPAAL